MPPDRHRAAAEGGTGHDRGHDDRSRDDQGWFDRAHHNVAERSADLAVATVPDPRRILDVGCGTGYVLRALAARCPHADRLDGTDPAPSMVAVAAATTGTGRVRCHTAEAEQLPFPDDTFDLVVTVTSFDHWSDQPAGLRECRRVLRPGGSLVLVDQFSSWMAPTLLVSRRARTRRRCTRLLLDTGYTSPEWHPLYTVLKAVTATA